MPKDYSNILYKIGVLNQPVQVGDEFYIRTKGQSLGMSEQLFELVFEQEAYGLIPVWRLIGSIRTGEYTIKYSDSTS
jgi:hypothetical protein